MGQRCCYCFSIVTTVKSSLIKCLMTIVYTQRRVDNSFLFESLNILIRFTMVNDVMCVYHSSHNKGYMHIFEGQVCN